MTKNRKLLKLLTLPVLCLFVIAGGFSLATSQAFAISLQPTPVPEHKYEPGVGTNFKIKTWVPEVKVIGELLLVGENQSVDISSRDGIGAEVKIKSVVDSEWDKYDYWVQGVHIDERWVSYGNMQHLYNLYNSNISGQGYADNGRAEWPSNAYAQEFVCREGTRYEVVAYDDKWVTFWSDGLKGYSGIRAKDCNAYMLKRTHQAGFYKVERSKVYLNIYAEQNVASSRVYEGEGYVTGSNLRIFNKPGDTGTGHCSTANLNSQVYVVDPTPVPSVNPKDTATYYKVLFFDCNYGGYMNKQYYHGYMNSMYINYEPEGSVPKNAINCQITSSGKVSLYSAKDENAEVIGGASSGTVLYSIQEDTDSSWTAVLFSGRIGYVPTKYVKYGVSNLKVKTVKDNQYVLSWDKAPIKFIAKAYNGSKVIWTSKELSSNQVTIPNSVFDKGSGTIIKEITVKVMAADATSGGKSVTLKNYGSPIAPTVTPQNQQIVVSSTGDCKIQYATNKNFKNAKIVTGKSGSTIIKGLKKNTTYYVRYAYVGKVSTANGKKSIRGAWSKVKTVKTKNITVKTPTLKSVSGGKKSVYATWSRPSGQVSGYEVVYATDKNFKKNVKKMDVTLASYTKWEQTKLKAKTKYYVRVRAYYEQGNERTYSNWSKTKTVKTK
ncbi:MAG: fibronectin type III domain-containing protein [Firmicutes bacterium]|nr:fibronectin type III domain-containing protein [Bacillota bacterium]